MRTSSVFTALAPFVCEVLFLLYKRAEVEYDVNVFIALELFLAVIDCIFVSGVLGLIVRGVSVLIVKRTNKVYIMKAVVMIYSILIAAVVFLGGRVV